eukprot:TRINITY_DN62708_c0_g1_i1.p1 TRINITY_DN62708_c0_g1~~TRINITY_DN62708_c0_g1_i1.p1  ORF type:complete len:394 (-),score=72.92 TRINITY_DN62708_c0_g1_i1:143-1231(-)
MGGLSSCLCGCGVRRDPPISSARPLRVAVSGAAGQIGYSLLPMIAQGEMFGRGRRVILQGLDLQIPSTKENMQAIKMELQDGNFPLLVEAIMSTDERIAFKDADYAILLGSFPRMEGREDREIMEKNVTIFRTMGRAIEKYAARDCKVIVVGKPSNTNALICSHYAPKLPKENFFALTRLDHNRTLGQLAERAHVPSGDVRNVVIWGRSASTPDVDHALAKGKRIGQMFAKDADRQWLRETLPAVVQQRGDSIYKARKASSAMSAARSIVDHVHDLHCGTRKGEFVSMGVWSKGNKYGVAENLYYSFPVTCRAGGRFAIYSGLKASPDVVRRRREAELALKEERDLACEVFSKHDSAGNRVS